MHERQSKVYMHERQSKVCMKDIPYERVKLPACCYKLKALELYVYNYRTS